MGKQIVSLILRLLIVFDCCDGHKRVPDRYHIMDLGKSRSTFADNFKTSIYDFLEVPISRILCEVQQKLVRRVQRVINDAT